MKQVAAIAAINLAAVTAATLIAYRLDPRDAVIEQIRREHQELVLHDQRIEQMLTAVLNQRTVSVANEPRVQPSASQVHSATDVGDVAAQRIKSEEQAAHDQLVLSGNMLVDRTIASGLVKMSDFTNLAAETRGLSADERAKIMARLSAAINTNQVRLESSNARP